MEDIISTKIRVQDSGENSEVVVATMTKEEWVEQFSCIKRITRGCLVITWLVLIGYFKTQGITVVENVIGVLFSIVTIQLWCLAPKK